MTIVSIKSGSSEDQRRIEFSDGSIFSFRICYLPPVFIDGSLCNPGSAEGREISKDEEERFRFASACLRAEKAALQLIARAEQNAFGLARKLEKRGHDSACARAVISRLCETGILDDRRYACLWLDSRISRQATSPRRLLIALNSRGIDRHDADSALKEALDDEAELRLLQRFAQKAQRKSTDAANAARSLRYLLRSEGFSPQAIQQFFDD